MSLIKKEEETKWIEEPGFYVEQVLGDDTDIVMRDKTEASLSISQAHALSWTSAKGIVAS